MRVRSTAQVDGDFVQVSSVDRDPENHRVGVREEEVGS